LALDKAHGYKFGCPADGLHVSHLTILLRHYRVHACIMPAFQCQQSKCSEEQRIFKNSNLPVIAIFNCTTAINPMLEMKSLLSVRPANPNLD